MNPILKNVLAVLAGVIIGSITNMGLVIIGSMIVPPPEGVDIMSPESLAVSMHLFEAKHFIFPFLAHALGTLVGALVTAKIAVSHQMKLALGIGVWFLIGGAVNISMMPGSPMWFNVLDLVVAYLPMGWLGGKLALKQH